MAETQRKGKTPEEIAAVTGGDAGPIREAISGIRIVREDEDED